VGKFQQRFLEKANSLCPNDVIIILRYIETSEKRYHGWSLSIDSLFSRGFANLSIHQQWEDSSKDSSRKRILFIQTMWRCDNYFEIHWARSVITVELASLSADSLFYSLFSKGFANLSIHQQWKDSSKDSSRKRILFVQTMWRCDNYFEIHWDKQEALSR